MSSTANVPIVFPPASPPARSEGAAPPRGVQRLHLKHVPLHPLPQHVTELLRRAVNKALPDLADQGLNTPDGINFYALSWGVLYFISGDHDHALMRLERIHHALGEGVAPPVTEPEAESDPLPVVYEIPKGARSKLCDCGARIWFVKTPAGERMPVTQDGVSHFGTCDSAGKHSRKKTAERKAA